MKYVYLIMSEQYMPELEHHANAGVVEFVFTSEKSANKQMDAIVELVNQDKLYQNLGHSIEFDNHIVDFTRTCIRRKIRINHPNDAYTIYTLQKVELNSGYGI